MDMDLLEKQEQASKICFENFRLLRRHYESHQLDQTRPGGGDWNWKEEKQTALQLCSAAPDTQPDSVLVDPLGELGVSTITSAGEDVDPCHHEDDADLTTAGEPGHLDPMIQLEKQLLDRPGRFNSLSHTSKDSVGKKLWNSRMEYYIALSRSLGWEPSVDCTRKTESETQDFHHCNDPSVVGTVLHPAPSPSTHQNVCNECNMKMSGCCWEKRMNTPD